MAKKKKKEGDGKVKMMVGNSVMRMMNDNYGIDDDNYDHSNDVDDEK